MGKLRTNHRLRNIVINIAGNGFKQISPADAATTITATASAANVDAFKTFG